MRKNVNIGRSLGHIEFPEGTLIPPQEVEDWPDEKIVVISTGSQGEPLSALRRMAHNDHRMIKLHRGDTVVFSATPIPGNERAVNETVDRLFHIGCEVITPREAPIHASGHGYAEELKLMLNLLKPRYVMPVHGDYKRIRLHAAARRRGRNRPRRRVPGRERAAARVRRAAAPRWGEPEQSGMIFVDGVDIGDPADVALRDRRMLSGDGIFIVVATVSEQSGESVVPPEVIFRGVPFVEQADSLVEDIREEVERSLAQRGPRRRPRDRHAPAGAARRPGGVRVRPAQAPADGAAGRRRGLISAARAPAALSPTDARARSHTRTRRSVPGRAGRASRGSARRAS